MDTGHFDGTHEITPNATPEQVAKALDSSDTASVRLFMPGKLSRTAGGARVVCAEDGKWYRILGEVKPPKAALKGDTRTRGQ